MNRLFILLGGVGFLTLILMIALVFSNVINPINWLKYLVLLCSISLTFISLGIFLRKSDLSTGFSILMMLLLILPFFAPLFGLFNTEYITDYWKLFIGGSIFQIGTGIFVLLGGFVRKDSRGLYRILNIFNYAAFLFIVLILVFNLTGLMDRGLFFILGVLLSVLSLFLVFFKREEVV